MHSRIKYIVEDLLPLYQEDLLHAETKEWLEEQLENSEEYRLLLQRLSQPLPQPEIETSIDYHRMMGKIGRKLSLYQIVFVALSFFLAIQTSLLNDSFGFILWYTVLGLIVYSFYRNWVMLLMISFIPVMLWSVGLSLSDLTAGTSGMGAETDWKATLLPSLFGGIIMAGLHGIFAVIGGCMGWLIAKLRERGKNE